MERSRTKSGQWRRKRSDAGTRRGRGIPTTNLGGILSAYGRRGYTKTMLGDPKSAAVQLTKPLPDGRRKHVRIYKGRSKFIIKEHTDRRDPARHPIGHLTEDLSHRARDSTRSPQETVCPSLLIWTISVTQDILPLLRIPKEQ